jgi:SAM-dependent methyltransferase
VNKIKFDAVFSNACLHWCKRDPGGVLESAKRVLKPGGRFVGEMGGFANCIGELWVASFTFTLLEWASFQG